MNSIQKMKRFLSSDRVKEVERHCKDCEALVLHQNLKIRDIPDYRCLEAELWFCANDNNEDAIFNKWKSDIYRNCPNIMERSQLADV